MLRRSSLWCLGVVLVCGFIAAPASRPIAADENVPEITVPELKALLEKEPNTPIYDVRTPDEYNQGHIKGAILIPLRELPGRYTEIPQHKKVVVYCMAGGRSARAVAFLRAHGYDEAVSLAGGYAEWSRSQSSDSK